MRKQIFPAERFDKKFGTNLSRKWIMPKGWDEHTIGDEWNRRTKTGMSLSSQIVDLNPELLKVIKPIIINEEGDKLQELMYGIISRFNLDDILFFIHAWRPVVFGEKANNYRQVLRGVENQLKIKNGFGWVISPKSLIKVLEINNIHVKEEDLWK